MPRLESHKIRMSQKPRQPQHTPTTTLLSASPPLPMILLFCHFYKVSLVLDLALYFSFFVCLFVCLFSLLVCLNCSVWLADLHAKGPVVDDREPSSLALRQVARGKDEELMRKAGCLYDGR